MNKIKVAAYCVSNLGFHLVEDGYRYPLICYLRIMNFPQGVNKNSSTCKERSWNVVLLNIGTGLFVCLFNKRKKNRFEIMDLLFLKLYFYTISLKITCIKSTRAGTCIDY